MLQPVTIRGDSHILEAEVDPNGNAVVTRSTLDSHLHAEVPVTARILDERASAEPVHLKAVGVPDAKVMPGETDGVAGPLRRPALERNPAEGTAPAATAAPTQAHLAGRLPLRGVLLADLVDGRRADQVELGTGAANERGEIEAGEKPALAAEDLELVRVARVPDSVDLTGHAAKKRNVPILDTYLQRLDRKGVRGRTTKTWHVSTIDEQNAKVLPAGVSILLPAVNGGVSKSRT